MNTFMNLRQKIRNNNNPDAFSILYLKQYKSQYNFHNPRESFLFDSVSRIKSLSLKPSISDEEAIEALWNLGKNEYLDRIIADLILKNQSNLSPYRMEKTLRFVLADHGYDEAVVYNVLDLAIELNMKIIEEEAINFLLDAHEKHQDVISILVDYCHSFMMVDLLETLLGLLHGAHADNIKLQVIAFMKECQGNTTRLEEILSHKPLYQAYVNLLSGLDFDKEGGLTLVQSMFQGDFDADGKGNNGGVAVLLKNLGNALSKDDQVGMVVSISINNDWSDEKEMVHTYSKRHKLIRVPVYIDAGSKDPYVKKERFIVRVIRRIMASAMIEPDVFHVRYLDNASKSMALLGEELGTKLVFTLTPDPHRQMFNKDGQLKAFDNGSYLSKLNKIHIGDELILKSDGILGIGNEPLRAELEQYFPQLHEASIGHKLNMIDEAVDTDFDEKGESSDQPSFFTIPESFLSQPVIINVGRLNSIKGQDQLIQAWGNSGLSETHRLLIIGGDLINPSPQEQVIIHSIETYLAQNPHLRDKFLHIGAMPNQFIRAIERRIVASQEGLPNIYLCSSKKEEFGIAILEAMAEGLLVIAPQNGGPKSYIDHGQNGYLIDTDHWTSIAADAKKIMYESQTSIERFGQIQKAGRQTVLTTFNLDRISRVMLNFYLGLEEAVA